MSTYQSSQTSNFANASTVTVTKPTSLAVGEKLVVQLVHASTSGTPASFTVPAGWTEQFNALSAGTLSDKVRMQILIKNADAGDVAASDFTFTLASGSGFVAGAATRISSAGIVAGSATVTQDDSVTSPISFSGFTPTRPDNLLMMFACTYGTAGSIGSFSTYAVATSNPTWTERYDLNNGTQRSAMAMATATRPETTATGNASLAAVLPTNADTIVYILALSTQVDGSHAAVENKLNAYAFAPIQSAKANAVTDEPTAVATNPTVWTPITKA